MRVRGAGFAAAALGVAVAVALVGAALVAPESRRAVWVGALVGGVLQAVMFALVAALVSPGRRWMAYSVGMVARFAALALVAFVGLPLLGLPAAPLLFSLVTVFFLTTMLEPFFLHRALTTVG